MAFAHGALPEIVVDGETGLLVTPEDEDAMARGITGLLEEPEKAKTMGKHGGEQVASRFAAERMAAKFTEILAQVLGGERQ